MWPIRFYQEGDPKGSTDVVDDSIDQDNPDLDNGADDIDPRITDDDTVDDKPKDDKPTELDDAAILKALESRGTKKSDSLAKIVAVLNDNPALAKMHQSLTGTMKAVRAKLEADGIDADVFVGEAVSGYDGREPSKSKKAQPTPAVLQGYKPEQLEALGQAIKHYAGPDVIKAQLEELMPAIISAVTGHLDFTTFAESKGENTDELQEKLQKIAKKHGITGRGKETLALLYELAEKELKGAVEDLSGNESGVHQTTVIGSPPPKGRDRKGVGTEKKKPQTDADWAKEAKERGVTE